jgi:hypothetical protein
MRSITHFTFWMVWVLLIGVLGCTLDRNKAVDTEKDPFHTYQDTRLFFKNVRQLYYEIEERKEAKMNLYRIRERSQTNEYPLINLAIIDNWIKDEAYIYLEPNVFFDEMDPLEVRWEAPTGASGTYKLEVMNKEGMRAFAHRLFEGIRSGQTFYVTIEEQQHPFLDNPKDREAFRKTMSDFYRLTRVL